MAFIPNVRPRPALPEAAAKRSFRLYHSGYVPRCLLLEIQSCPTNPHAALNPDNFAIPLTAFKQMAFVLANNSPGDIHVSTREENSLGERVESVMLLPGEYTYVIDNKPKARWPVCTRFDDWTPTNSPPQDWLPSSSERPEKPRNANLSSVSVKIKEQDSRCVVTGRGDMALLDAAHIIPKTAKKWFMHHTIFARTGDVQSIDSPWNLITLSMDFSGRMFDAGDFCFYPWGDKWILIWTGGICSEAAFTYNFTEVVLPQRVPAYYVWIRLVWNTFKLADLSLRELPRAVIKVPKATLEPAEDNDDDGDNGGDGNDDGDNDDGDNDCDGNDDGDNDNDNDNNDDDVGNDVTRQNEGNKKPSRKRKREKEPTRASSSRRRTGARRSRAVANRPYDLDNDDPLDLSYLTPAILPRLREIDKNIRDSKLPYDDDSNRYPGFSDGDELRLLWRATNPASVDPGQARIARVSEREE
ncbi:hypothetical protein C8F01DRAFT_1246292 [Mycena amicta]|nr:hypothetical protein C8F01DRAFT_1246292 [Mycena amicta]